jgi:Fic family protein
MMHNKQNIFEQYKSLEHVVSLEDERKRAFKYVYFTNKLEGNKLTLAQTTELLDSDTISGDNIRTRDILEQKGMYKAFVRMMKGVRDKQELSLDFMVELNGLALGSLWKDDTYYSDAKYKGQEINSLKVSKNIISITEGGEEIRRIEPLSSPSDVKENMTNLIRKINASDANIVNKSISLAKQIWLHQPFIDGNKRVGRLLISFLTMKNGYPLFAFEDTKKGNYNSLLIQEYMDNKDDLLINYVNDRLMSEMSTVIELNKTIEKPNKNFGMYM